MVERSWALTRDTTVYTCSTVVPVLELYVYLLVQTLLQGSAHTGQRWSAPTTTLPSEPPRTQASFTTTHIVYNNTKSLFFHCHLAKHNHHSDHPGQNLATIPQDAYITMNIGSYMHNTCALQM